MLSQVQQPSRSATQSRLPDLETVVPLARSLAQREAHRADDVDDLMQVALLAFHLAARSHRRRRQHVNNPWALTRTIMIRAMRSYYFQQREWEDRGQPHRAASLEDAEIANHRAVCVGLDGQCAPAQQLEMFDLQDYFDALERTCGVQARLVVENLILPSGECSAYIIAEVERKRRLQEQFRRRRVIAAAPRGVKERVRISQRLVREALGLTETEWAHTLTDIRVFTRQWLGHDA